MDIVVFCSQDFKVCAITDTENKPSLRKICWSKKSVTTRANLPLYGAGTFCFSSQMCIITLKKSSHTKFTLQRHPSLTG